MRATLLVREQVDLGDGQKIEVVLWRVPKSVAGSKHNFKYRLALVHNKICALRYDNEAGKGDHKHIGNAEFRYEFTTIRQLQEDFLNDVAMYQKGDTQ